MKNIRRQRSDRTRIHMDPHWFGSIDQASKKHKKAKSGFYIETSAHLQH
jgi:hypothetical protein